MLGIVALFLFGIGLVQGFKLHPTVPYIDLPHQTKYDLQWYVIGSNSDFTSNIPRKTTIWNKSYVVWKNRNGQYNAVDDACSHKGASLSGGVVKNNCIMCPYHGYEFNGKGELEKVPGIEFRPSPQYNVGAYKVIEKNGWV
jgi:phenylpropionate dioxygenase-like ring-hydroxylating dioxygenase large terminal subunit